jgi:List-Bact-rpt repeat protein
MPGTNVYDIARRPSDGLIAIANNQPSTWPYTGGVSTFDGTTWTHYTPDNSPLTHWQVVAVEFDANGNLWASPYSEGAVQIMLGNAPTPTPTPTPPPTAQVTVQTNPVGRTFSVDGTTYSSTQTFSWVSGSSHTIATTSPQSGSTGVRYVWTRWSDNGAISHTVAPTINKSYTATFRTQYYLTMTHGTGGTVGPTSGWRNSGASISISAMPADGYRFTNWSGSGAGSYSGTNNPASIIMRGPITDKATFTHN